MGATEFDLAIASSVAHSTIWRWQAEHIEFFESAQEGKARFDHRVERSVATRAIGYDQVTRRRRNTRAK